MELSDYHAGDWDAREYRLKVIFFTLALYGCFAAFALGALGLYWMAALTSVLVTRWMIAFHELLHLRSAEQLDFFTRLLPIPFAPLNIGYREYRMIHAEHHRYTATAEDPDAFHILGGHLKALFGAVTLHEQQLYRYIKRFGLSSELLVMAGVRLVVFVVLLVMLPQQFLLWWLVLRLTYTVNDFVFFHLVHYRTGNYGTYPIPLPSFILYPLIGIYGIDVVYATMHHDLHHDHQRIAAKYLQTVAAQLGSK